MKKVDVKNRKRQKIVTLIEESQTPKGFVFVMHGLSDFKKQPHISKFAEALKNKGIAFSELG